MSYNIKKTKSGINAQDLALAMAEATKCGSGIDPKTGILVLPNYNPVSGDKDGFYAVYLVDGSLTIEPVADARATLAGYCNISEVTALSVSITGCPEADAEVNDEIQLTAVVLPSGALQTGVWSSDDTDIATVDGTGLVTAVAAGTVTITFTTTDGGLTATCEITIIEP